MSAVSDLSRTRQRYHRTIDKALIIVIAITVIPVISGTGIPDAVIPPRPVSHAALPGKLNNLIVYNTVLRSTVIICSPIEIRSRIGRIVRPIGINIGGAQSHILAVHIPISAVVIRRIFIVVASRHLEGQCIRSAVVIDLDDAVALGVDGLAAVGDRLGLPEPEAGILHGIAIHRDIGAVGALDDLSESAVDGCVLDDRRFIQVVPGTGHILAVDDDRIGSGGFDRPLGIDNLVLGELFREIILFHARRYVLAVGVLRLIPADEGIARAQHLFIGTRLTPRGIAGLDELRRAVGGALAVLIKNEPMAFGSADREDNVAGNVKSRSVRIIVYRFAVYGLGLSVTRVAFNITGTVFDSPAFEVM